MPYKLNYIFLRKRERENTLQERKRNKSNIAVTRLAKRWLILSKIILVKCSFKLLSTLLFAYGYRTIIPVIASDNCRTKFSYAYSKGTGIQVLIASLCSSRSLGSYSPPHPHPHLHPTHLTTTATATSTLQNNRVFKWANQWFARA